MNEFSDFFIFSLLSKMLHFGGLTCFFLDLVILFSQIEGKFPCDKQGYCNLVLIFFQ